MGASTPAYFQIEVMMYAVFCGWMGPGKIYPTPFKAYGMTEPIGTLNNVQIKQNN
jgi:hypothetical protein